MTYVPRRRPTSLLPLTRPWLDTSEAQAAFDAVANGDLIGDGRICRRTEAALSSALGGARALLLNSCTSALEIAIQLTGAAGGEVILPSFTFVSCANAVIRAGARPVFADVNPSTLNIDPDAIAACVTPSTRAVVVVHYAGRACDMEPILALAQRRGFAVIEDAAHALGGTWQGRALGTIGDFGCFSFHGTKDVVCGEGGALVCRDPAQARSAEIIREKGTNRAAFLRGDVDKYTWVDVGSSFVLSDTLAAILEQQLRRLPAILARKRELAQALTHRLEVVGDRMVLPREWPGAASTWHLYPILVAPERRDAMLDALRAEGIGAAFHYVPLHSSPYGTQRLGYRALDLPHTERVSASLIRLPLFAAMSDAELERVADATVSVATQLLSPIDVRG